MRKNQKFNIHSRKNVGDFQLKFLRDLSGAKVCKYCRSRQELSDVEEEFSEYVRYCYGYLSKFSFFSLSPCPFFSIFFSNRQLFQRVFTCKSWLRYSRERALKSSGNWEFGTSKFPLPFPWSWNLNYQARFTSVQHEPCHSRDGQRELKPYHSLMPSQATPLNPSSQQTTEPTSSGSNSRTAKKDTSTPTQHPKGWRCLSMKLSIS